MILKKKHLALVLTLALVVALFAACGPRGDTTDDNNEPTPGPDNGNLEFERTFADITPDWSYEIEDRYSYNDHTVGWLDVPGTNISDVVVRNPEDRNNLYYLRRNFQREFYFNGIFYIDFRADLGPTRDYLGVNTTIYGHAMTDDPEHPDFDIMFGQLHKFRDLDFTSQNPYIFFSLPEENLAFEIIAIFYGNSDNPAFSYNDNPANAEDFIHVIEETVLPRSLFHYDGVLSPDDRFLTLSTCIYNPTGGVTLLHHSETQYRFGIMARLLDPDAPVRGYREFAVNEERIVDPDGHWPR
ncbi:MAG: class B sortase [Oscillospiraceae bacterium]|nr:class B sortase [Oscillospiraceae bacterium]